MSATRRLADHSCRTFVMLAEVLRALAKRHDSRGVVGLFDKGLTPNVYRNLKDSRATHRCADCKRWVSVTPAHFRPDATPASLTRLTADERRQLQERPIVFTVSPHLDGSDAPYLAKLPAYGFDVRHPYTEEIRGPRTMAWRYRFKGTLHGATKFARNAR